MSSWRTTFTAASEATGEDIVAEGSVIVEDVDVGSDGAVAASLSGTDEPLFEMVVRLFAR